MSSTSASIVRGISTGAIALAASPAVYLGALSVAGAGTQSCATATGTRFAIVVPAHNEQVALAATLASLNAIDYDDFSIIVVADNCDDDTAEIARLAGATVIERFDDVRRGKGYALATAFDDPATADADMVVVIDADTIVDPELLSHLAWHFQQGSAAVQVDYRVRNPEASWRTALLDVSFTAKHLVRSRGRSRLGLSVGLRGNGMAFTRSLLNRVPYEAFSAVEDVEFGLAIAAMGDKVDGCNTTWVAGDMPDNAEDAVSQRVRWEGGHRQLAEARGWSLLRRGSASLDPVAVDAAVDVLTPPLARMVLHLSIGTTVSWLVRKVVGPLPMLVALVGWLSLLLHLVVAVASCRSPRRAIAALASVPNYLWWKLRLGRQQRPSDWVRTERSEFVSLSEGT